MGHKVQGSDVEKYYFTQRGLEQAGITILPFDEKNLDGDMEIIAGNAFRPDNNVEIAYADQNGISYKRYHEFLGNFMRDFVSMGVAGAHGKNFTTGMLSHVLSHITDTSFLIGDGTGRGSANAKYFVFESDEYERHFMPYHPEYSIITNIDFDHPDYFTSLEDVFKPLTTMLNKLAKVCLSTVKMLNCVRLRLMLRFIIMVLKQKVMTLSLVIFFVQQLVQPSQFISVVKN